MKISEIFRSVQGEGPYTGMPSVFVRTVGCNLRCEGFPGASYVQRNIDSVEDITESDFTSGCDSRYSWDKNYQNLWEDLSISSIVNTVGELAFTRDYHLVLTGGEPTLHQKDFSSLFDSLLILPNRPASILIETNGSVPIKIDMQSLPSCLIWSNSPKLAFTGERRRTAWNKSVIDAQYSTNSDIYFKFAVRGEQQDFDEICEYLKYVDREDSKVCVMPAGASLQSQVQAAAIYDLCLKYGFQFQLRTHIVLFGNKAKV